MDLLAILNGGKKFSKLALSYVYQKLLLHKDSKELLRVNTHKGLSQSNRLQYGVHLEVGIFQIQMEKRSNGIPFSIGRMDDVLISGKK